MMAAVLDETGWLDTVKVNRRTSELWPPGERFVETLVDGHMRVELALQHEMQEVPVAYVDLTPDEEAVALATFNPIGEMAKANKSALDNVIRNVHSDSHATHRLIAEIAKKNKLYDAEKNPCEQPGLSEEMRFPLAILVNKTQCRRWQDLKDQFRAKTDTELLLMMMDRQPLYGDGDGEAEAE